ncbi:hypothetical protein FW778_19735 [Ginsengibacter hankyongi]|uniref:Uncharacterized protein n=1 Tax=Ginsengibacter hankyongi TaxID=2607284 RepID=A0A5J5IG91_9BACT|nr:hypothetical protein [Ginsengibacter hankyongi]KAA9036121.1 hypothetical protein FW778_19735 [Ginsengibacter hankyongi]
MNSSAINVISSTFHDNASVSNTNCTLNINLLDKYIERVGENKKLYQVLLKEKDEKIALLEKTMGKK